MNHKKYKRLLRKFDKITEDILITKLQILDRLEELSNHHSNKNEVLKRLFFWIRILAILYLIINIGKIDHLTLELIGMLLGTN